MKSRTAVITPSPLSIFILLCAGFSLVGNVHSAGIWEGDSGPFWQTPGNWDDGTVPDTNVDVIINGAGTDDPIVDGVGPGENARNVTIGNNGGAGALTIQDTASLSIAENLIISEPNSSNAGEVSVTGNTALLIVDGELSINNGGNGASQLKIENGADVAVSGTTTVNQGTVIEFSGTGSSTLQGAGELIVDGALLFDHSSGGITIDKDLSGSGLISVSSGAGTARLNGNNTSFTGTYRVTSGELNTPLAANALGGQNGSASLVVDGGRLLTAVSTQFSSLSGTGGVIELASGAHLHINQATDTTFAGTIESSGNLTKSGTGTLTLAGNNTYDGGTTVTEGTLAINGTLGDVAVDGGSLGGNGTLENITVNSGGTVAPGNSIGTINTTSVTFNPGAIYEVELNDGGFVAGTHNDFINATGTAMINGGTVHITPENGIDDGVTYLPGDYTIISADSGVMGVFNTLTDDYAFLDFALSYDATNVFLHSSMASGSFCLNGMSNNQCATGHATYSLGLGNSLFNTVLNLSNTEAPNALDQLSGEIHASAKTALIEDSRFIREAALARLASVTSAETTTAWVQGIGSKGDWDSNHNSAKLSRNTQGLILGGDIATTPAMRLGAFAGYTQSDFDIAARNSDSDIESWHLGIYGGGLWDAWKLSVGGGWSGHDINTTRDVSFTGITEVLAANYDAQTMQAFGELSYSIEYGSVNVKPFVNLSHVHLKTDRYTEAGGDTALEAQSQDMDTSYSTIGLHATTEVRLQDTKTQITGSAGWRQAFGDLKSKTTHAFASSDQFTLTGAPVSNDSLIVNFGASMMLTPHSTLGLNYNGLHGSDFTDYGVKINFSTKF